MTISNKFLVNSFGGILLLTILFGISLYLCNKSDVYFYAAQGVQNMISGNNSSGNSGGFLASAQTDFSFSKFDQIKTYGKWDVVIKRGDKYQVKVFAEKEDLSGVVVEQQGDILSFKMKGGLFSAFKSRISAEVVLPHLKKIEATLQSRIAFAEFKGDSLSIVAAGACYLESQNNNFKRVDIESAGASKITMLNDKFTNLDVDISGAGFLTAKMSEIVDLSFEATGASKADLTSSKVTNATVDLFGASRLIINMNGGDLKGEVGGASKIVYSGDVRAQEVSTFGASSVVKK